MSFAGNNFDIRITSVPSKGQRRGTGYCGAGEEITLSVYEIKSKSIVFSKLIESCLENIELKDGTLGSETKESIAHALKFREGAIDIDWLTFEQRSNVVGRISLTSEIPSYEESFPTEKLHDH